MVDLVLKRKYEIKLYTYWGRLGPSVTLNRYSTTPLLHSYTPPTQTGIQFVYAPAVCVLENGDVSECGTGSFYPLQCIKCPKGRKISHICNKKAYIIQIISTMVSYIVISPWTVIQNIQMSTTWWKIYVYLLLWETFYSHHRHSEEEK